VRKLFHFDSPRENYRCDAAVVWCFDNRFDLVFRKFLKRIGAVSTDEIKIAGGAKILAAPDRESDREFVVDQIRKSIQLHDTSRVILMVHSDCGAYGGLEGRFHGDVQAEAEHLGDDLRSAANFLHTSLPGLVIEGYFVDFEGVWEPAPGAQTVRV
jgi:carbonic anhydrase